LSSLGMQFGGNAAVHLEYSWSYDLIFGLQNTGDARTACFVDTSPLNELHFDLAATTPNLGLYGSFGPFQVQITQQQGVDDQGNTVVNPSLLLVGFQADLFTPGNGSGLFRPLNNEKLDLGVEVQGGGDLNFHVQTSPFGGSTDL